MKRLIILLALVLAACQPAAPSADAINTAIAQTQIAQPTSIPPTETQAPSPTTAPTSTIAPTPTESTPAGNHYAWNYVASQENGGLLIEIARIVVADKATMGNKFDSISDYDDKPVVVELVFRITNNTDKVISIYPDQGTVIVGSEQISLTEYLFHSSFGDIGGDIYPGVTKIGGIWFGVKRTPIDEILKITIAFSGPTDADFNTLGSDLTFEIDLSNRQDQPLPDELK